jgi:hypothetical protein
LESVDGLHSASGECFASVGEHPQGFELSIELQHPQRLGADRDDGDRVGVASVCFAVVAGVEQADPGSELRRDIDNAFAVLEQALGERSAGSVAAFNRPDPVGPAVDVLAHRGIADTVGGEPTRAQQPLVVVDDLDRRRQLVGIDPDDDMLDDLCHVLLPPVLIAKWTARWALLLRAGQSLLEPRLVTVTDETQTEREPHL